MAGNKLAIHCSVLYSSMTDHNRESLKRLFMFVFLLCITLPLAAHNVILWCMVYIVICTIKNLSDIITIIPKKFILRIESGVCLDSYLTAIDIISARLSAQICKKSRAPGIIILWAHISKLKFMRSVQRYDKLAVFFTSWHDNSLETCLTLRTGPRQSICEDGYSSLRRFSGVLESTWTWQ